MNNWISSERRTTMPQNDSVIPAGTEPPAMQDTPQAPPGSTDCSAFQEQPMIDQNTGREIVSPADRLPPSLTDDDWKELETLGLTRESTLEQCFDVALDLSKRIATARAEN